MDDRLECEVIKVKFKLEESPIAVQMTKHLSNMISTYGSKSVLSEFKSTLSDKEFMAINTVRQLVNHYGKSAWEKWFSDIYGWDLKKEVA